MGIKGRHGNEKVANDVSDDLRLVICHEEFVVTFEFLRSEVKLFDSVCADDIHLGTFIKHEMKRVFIMSNGGDLRSQVGTV